MINVKLLRIVTGEEVIAELVSEDENTITVKNGLVVLPSGNSYGFAPWATVIHPDMPEIGLDMKHVIYSVAVADPVVKQYNEIFGSNIVLPDKQLIV